MNTLIYDQKLFNFKEEIHLNSNIVESKIKYVNPKILKNVSQPIPIPKTNNYLYNPQINYIASSKMNDDETNYNRDYPSRQNKKPSENSRENLVLNNSEESYYSSDLINPPIDPPDSSDNLDNLSFIKILNRYRFSPSSYEDYKMVN